VTAAMRLAAILKGAESKDQAARQLA